MKATKKTVVTLTAITFAILLGTADACLRCPSVRGFTPEGGEVEPGRQSTGRLREDHLSLRVNHLPTPALGAPNA